MLVWLHVYSKVQMTCIWSSWCHCHLIISCFKLLDQNPEWLAFLVPAYRVCPGKEAVYKSVKGVWRQWTTWTHRPSCPSLLTASRLMTADEWDILSSTESCTAGPWPVLASAWAAAERTSVCQSVHISTSNRRTRSYTRPSKVVHRTGRRCGDWRHVATGCNAIVRYVCTALYNVL